MKNRKKTKARKNKVKTKGTAVRKRVVKKATSKHLRKNKRKMAKAKAPVEKPLSAFKSEDQKDIIAVREVQAGNKEAYVRILERYRAHVVQRFFLKVKDRVLAEDLAAEVLTKAYEKLGQYRSTYTFNSWFYVLADRFLIDWSRKAEWKFKAASVSLDNTRGDGDGGNVTSFVENMTDPTVSADANLLRSEQRKAIREGLATLDELGRRLILMFFAQDKQYDEIAKEIGMNTNTMRVQLMRAKKKLGEYIERAYPEFKMRVTEGCSTASITSEKKNVDGEDIMCYLLQ